MKKGYALCITLLLLFYAALPAAALETLPGEFATNAPMALVIAGERLEGVYSGQVVDGLPEGQGVFSCFDAAEEARTYSGTWENGHLFGWAVVLYADGKVEAGLFSGDRLHGNGMEIAADHIAYSGEYINGLPAVTESFLPETEYSELKKGDKGDAVLALQERLVALGYLSGKQDGLYGGKTESAVRNFQEAAQIEADGIASPATQAALFREEAASDAAAPSDSAAFAKLDYAEIERNPDQNMGKRIAFTGSVLQVIENANGPSTYRIATKDSYGDIMYVQYLRPAGAPRPLKGDTVSIKGVCTGVTTYIGALDTSITLPSCDAESIEIAK